MSYILNKKNQKIAYKKIKGKKPGVIFIHGLQSDMNGKKANSIEKFIKNKGHAFIKFECRGHGKSYGKFENYCISDWKNDLLFIIDKLSTGPQILIGSSMGGWLMMLAARARKKRIISLLGIAAAPDFTINMYNNLTKNNKKKLLKNGKIELLDNEYASPYTITHKLIKDGKKNLILKKQFKFNKKLILIHGLKDEVVSSDVPFEILKKTSSNNIQLKFLKNSGHSLSSNKDIKVIFESINELIKS